MQTNTTKKDLISGVNISSKELFEILTLSQELKSNPISHVHALRGESIAMIFAVKPSLRTRVSFEVGIHQIGAHAITIKMDEINIGKRENVEDIANVLSRYVSAIVIRTFEQKQIEDLAKFSSIPIINALTNEEHPCQAISDLFTIKEIFKDLNGLKLTYIGDGNNMAHSLLLCCAQSNINISVATPKGFEPSPFYVDLAKKTNPNINIEVTTDPSAAVEKANILYTDVWASMGQESEHDERKKLFSDFQINKELLKNTANNSIVLHCLPAHRGEEITSDVFNDFSNIIYTQAENRLHAQKAILLKLIGKQFN